METGMLLETYLKKLRLPTFLHNYAKFAQDAAREGLGYDHFLLALAEREMLQRQENQRRRRIQGARFPVHKELADFDFSCVPSLNKQRVLDLARGAYIDKAEPIILVGNPGLGKTHIATGLALAACRQGHRVRFYTAAGLVNELIQAQDEHRLSNKHQLIVLDELGFIPLLGHRRAVDLSVLLHIVRAGGDDRDDESPLRRLGAGLWRRTLDGCSTGPARAKPTSSSSSASRIAFASGCSRRSSRPATRDGLWAVWTAKERACPHCPQPRRRGGPLFDDQVDLFSFDKNRGAHQFLAQGRPPTLLQRLAYLALAHPQSLLLYVAVDLFLAPVRKGGAHRDHALHDLWRQDLFRTLTQQLRPRPAHPVPFHPAHVRLQALPRSIRLCLVSWRSIRLADRRAEENVRSSQPSQDREALGPGIEGQDQASYFPASTQKKERTSVAARALSFSWKSLAGVWRW